MRDPKEIAAAADDMKTLVDTSILNHTDPPPFVLGMYAALSWAAGGVDSADIASRVASNCLRKAREAAKLFHRQAKAGSN